MSRYEELLSQQLEIVNIQRQRLHIAQQRLYLQKEILAFQKQFIREYIATVQKMAEVCFPGESNTVRRQQFLNEAIIPAIQTDDPCTYLIEHIQELLK